MDQSIKDMLKQAIGITDADLNKLSPNIQNLLGNLPELMKHRLVAEVTESKYCFHGLKPGDKFVVEGGKLNPQASTAAPCMGALAPIDSFSTLLMAMIAGGVRPDGSVIGHTRCHDLGVDHGGLGEVYFKVYTEETQ